MAVTLEKKWIELEIDDAFLFALIPENRPTWRQVAVIRWVPPTLHSPGHWSVEASRGKLFDEIEVIGSLPDRTDAIKLAEELACQTLRRHGLPRLEGC